MARREVSAVNLTKAARAQLDYSARFNWTLKPGAQWTGIGDLALAQWVAQFQYDYNLPDVDGIIGHDTGRAMIAEAKTGSPVGKVIAASFDLSAFDFTEQNYPDTTPSAPAPAALTATPPPPSDRGGRGVLGWVAAAVAVVGLGWWAIREET